MAKSPHFLRLYHEKMAALRARKGKTIKKDDIDAAVRSAAGAAGALARAQTRAERTGTTPGQVAASDTRLDMYDGMSNGGASFPYDYNADQPVGEAAEWAPRGSAEWFTERVEDELEGVYGTVVVIGTMLDEGIVYYATPNNDPDDCDFWAQNFTLDRESGKVTLGARISQLPAVQFAPVADGVTASDTRPQRRAVARLGARREDAITLADDVSATMVALRLSDNGETLPRWQQLHKVGTHEVPHPSGQKIVFTKADGDSMISNFANNVLRRGVPLDERHLTDDNGVALGWYEELRWGQRGEGLAGRPEPSGAGNILYGAINYNSLGVTKLSDNQYKYISPQYRKNYVDKETGTAYGCTLMAVAATNNPFLRVRSIHGEEAADPVIALSDGLDTGDMPNVEDTVDPTMEERLAKLEAIAAAAEARAQAAEQRTTETESRLADSLKTQHEESVSVYLDAQVRTGLPPALSRMFRPLLEGSWARAEETISLSDDEGAPKTNVHKALKSIIEAMPRIPLGQVSLSDAEKRPASNPLDTVELDDAQVLSAAEYIMKEQGITRSRADRRSTAGQADE